MAWRKEAAHKLVRLKDVRKLTGLRPDEVLLQRDTQKLVRIGDDGAREEVVRIPIELLTDETEETES